MNGKFIVYVLAICFFVTVLSWTRMLSAGSNYSSSGSGGHGSSWSSSTGGYSSGGGHK